MYDCTGNRDGQKSVAHRDQQLDARINSLSSQISETPDLIDQALQKHIPRLIDQALQQQIDSILGPLNSRLNTFEQEQDETIQTMKTFMMQRLVSFQEILEHFTQKAENQQHRETATVPSPLPTAPGAAELCTGAITPTVASMGIQEVANLAQRQDAVEIKVNDLDARILQVKTKQQSDHNVLSFALEEHDKLNQKYDELKELIADLQKRFAHEVRVAGSGNGAVQHREPSPEAIGLQGVVLEQQQYMEANEEDAQRGQHQESQMETNTPHPIAHLCSSIKDQRSSRRSLVADVQAQRPARLASCRTSVLDVNLAYERIAELESYELRESVWDVSILFGMKVMRPRDELMVLLAGLINILIQVAFTVLVEWKMTDGDFNDDGIVQDYLDWRIMYAHDPKYADTFTNAPLAVSVCTLNPVNMESVLQASIYRDVHDYLEKVLGLESGVVLCLLACCLWVFECLRECENVWALVSSLWATVYYSGLEELTRFQRFLSARSGLVYQEKFATENDDAANKSIQFTCSLQRALLITVFTVIPRLAIAIALGSAGARFLAATRQLSEFVLNSITLGVVLSVDETLYEIFVPRVPKLILAKTIPLHFSRRISVVSSAIPFDFLKVLMAGAAVVLIYFLILSPIITNMEHVAAVMCGGDIDFLAAELSIGSVFAGTAQTKRKINRTKYSYMAILQRTSLKESSRAGPKTLYLDSRLPPLSALFPIPDVFQARLYQTFSVGTIAGASSALPYALRCGSDTFWQTGHPYVRDAITKLLEDVFAPHRPICQTLKDQGYCYSFSKKGTTARFFCPNTCGLSEPQSGNVFAGSEQGVPTSDCNRVIGRKLETVPCEDLPDSDPAFEVAATSLPNLLRDSFARFGNATWVAHETSRFVNLIRSGCQGVSQNRHHFVMTSMYESVAYDVVNMSCSPARLAGFGYEIRGLRFLCPKACGCLAVAQQYETDGKQWTPSIGLSENCPKSCFNFSLSNNR